ncbi:MAG: carbohydrate-binding domain-containing protein [Bacillaceae bacterium]
MKRAIKNIIFIILIILGLFSMYHTMNSANEELTVNMEDNATTNMAPPDMNEGNPPPNMNDEMTNKNNNMPNNGAAPEKGKMINIANQKSLTTEYYIYFGIESLITSILLIYLLMSIFNKKGFKETFINSDKVIIYLLSMVLLTSILTFGDVYITNNYFLNNEEDKYARLTPVGEDEVEKESVDVDTSNVVDDTNINLDDYDKDITIASAGTYTLTGSLKHALFINVDEGNVTLILDNVTIANTSTAAIAALKGDSVTISSKEGTTNTLSDGGKTDYDGVIYGEIPLIFDGEGTIIVNGNQTEGEGIATSDQDITINGGTIKITSPDDGINAGGDNGGTITINDGTIYVDAGGDGIDSNDKITINGGTLFVMGSDVGGDSGIDSENGYTINGGTVVAVGSDMLEKPQTSSKQKTLTFTLDSTISANTLVTLLDEGNDVIASFKSTKAFKTIIISSDKLTKGTYTLYSGGSTTGTLKYGIYYNGTYTKGSQLSVSNVKEFSVSNIINSYGK